MKLTLLYKDQNSGGNGCPSVYLGESGELVVQGPVVDAETLSGLENPLPGETAVRISPEIFGGAMEQYRNRLGGAR